MTTAAKQFGEYIKECRIQRGMDVATAAKESGMSRPFVYQLESGTKGIPSLRTLYYLSRTYRVQLEQLIDAALSYTLEEDEGYAWRRNKHSNTDIVREADAVYEKYAKLNKPNQRTLMLLADFLEAMQARGQDRRD